MAIVTDITVDIEIDNVKVDEYELSDTLDNYTIEEIQAAAYCGQYNIARRNNCLRTYDYGWVGAFDKDNGVFQYPFKIQPSGGSYIWNAGATGYNAPDGLYGGTVWLSAENSTFDSVITDQNASNYRVVTKWNVNKFIFTLPALSGDYGQVSSVTWEQKPYPACYIPAGWGTMTYHTAKGLPYDQTKDVLLRPYNVFVFEEKFFLIAIKVENGFLYNSAQEVGGQKVFGDSGHYSYDRSTAIATSYNADYESAISLSGTGFNRDFGLSTYPDGNAIPFTWQGPGGYAIWYQVACEDAQNYICFWSHSGYQSYGGYLRLNFYFCKVDDVLHYFANMGVYFYADKLYKPVIEDTIVTGYTDDMEAASDIDNWDGDTIHNVPITPPVPPTPTPEDDDYESMTTGFTSTLSGCTKYYLMSPLDIVTLIRDYYTHAFAGSTLSNSIISCYLCGLSPAEFISTDTPAPIKIPTVAGQSIFESVNSYKAIDAVVNKILVGNIGVPRMNNDFHDFSPYTIYEVFIPYCGWISLPDTVAGKHIYVEFHVDVRTMAGKAIVLIGADDGGKATCAEMCMNFGASTPFAVIEAGLERQAAVTAGIQTAIGTAAAITGISSGHNALTVSSIGTASQGIANGMMSSMANYTQVQGKAGDTSDFANGRQCYLKISWAKTDEVVNNSRFGHSIGYLCNTVGKIKDFKGLTVCANPHVNGIDCTESEKEEIKRLLEEGIIVN